MEDQEQEEKQVNKPRLKLITGGKPPDDPNWLSQLERGTHFLFRPKTRKHPDDIGVSRAVVVTHYPTSTLLFDNMNTEAYFCVETMPFSTNMRLIHIIGREFEVSATSEETLDEPK